MKNVSRANANSVLAEIWKQINKCIRESSAEDEIAQSIGKHDAARCHLTFEKFHLKITKSHGNSDIIEEARRRTEKEGKTRRISQQYVRSEKTCDEKFTKLQFHFVTLPPQNHGK